MVRVTKQKLTIVDCVQHLRGKRCHLSNVNWWLIAVSSPRNERLDDTLEVKFPIDLEVCSFCCWFRLVYIRHQELIQSRCHLGANNWKLLPTTLNNLVALMHRSEPTASHPVICFIAATPEWSLGLMSPVKSLTVINNSVVDYIRFKFAHTTLGETCWTHMQNTSCVIFVLVPSSLCTVTDNFC